MSERLTEKCSFGSYVVKDYADKGDTIEKVKNHEIIDKLGKLEDILEKYDLEVEELEELLDDNKYAQNVVVKQLVELQNAKNEENTWKKACELACDDLGLYEDVTTTQLKMKCYYQQAKKGNDSH